MEGFKFSLAGREPCLNLFFPDWTLDTPHKFFAAVVGVGALAVAVEGISALRYRIVRSVKQAHRRRRGAAPKATQALRLVVTLLHGLQGLLGYLLMLAIMTFSIELLLACVVGLAVGYGVFFQYDEAMGRVHVTTNPCCAFLGDEAREAEEDEEEDDEEEEEQLAVQEEPATEASPPETTTAEASPEETA